MIISKSFTTLLINILQSSITYKISKGEVCLYGELKRLWEESLNSDK